MPRTIQDSVDAAGDQVGDDELVNFGSQARNEIHPSTGPRSYWLRYGDIRQMTLPQVQAAIGGLASAGMPGGANFMRVSSVSRDSFTLRSGSGFFELHEYSIDVPVQVKCSIEVGWENVGEDCNE